MNKVVIFQPRLFHYRVGLFEMLRTQCLENSIELHLVHGHPTRRDKVRNDVGFLTWATPVDNWSCSISNQDLIWMPFPSHLRDADLVVIMQENRLLSNYPLLLSRWWSSRKIAYWGHGKNFQSNAPAGLCEKWKDFLLMRVDWWFAYTEMTVDILCKAGFPAERITRLDNAIDTSTFKADLTSWNDADIAAERERLGIAKNAPVGVFCGSLYPNKNLEFLIDSVDMILQKVPDFTLVVLGDGPSMPLMSKKATSRPWLHLLGVRTGREKALYFRMGEIMLNPGLVGLHIVDAFCGGLVMITTLAAKHSPEVAYLKDGVNGLMVSDSPKIYAAAVVELLNDRNKLERLKRASKQDSQRYTIKNMVEKFVSGIVKCLEARRL